MKVAGASVVVTGAAGGIGEAIARRCAARGAHTLTLVDIDADGVRAVADELGAAVAVADVGRRRDIDAAVAVAVDAHGGPVDIFFSNAGIFVPGGCEVAADQWQRSWDINVMAHVHAAAALAPGMIERGRGHLVATASAAGLLSQIGSAPYAVTKAAAVSLAEWLAITYGDQGLTVSVACPQAVATAMIAGVPGGGVAGVDGMLSADEAAEAIVAGVEADDFLILPHAEVADYVARKAADRPRWIAGMQRLRDRFGAVAAPPPPGSPLDR